MTRSPAQVTLGTINIVLQQKEKVMSTEQEDRADEPVRLVIEHRAYAIWESEGRPSGCDFDHWLRAEAEIMSSDSEDKSPEASTGAKKAS